MKRPNESEILFKAVNEHLHLGNLHEYSRLSAYLCHAVEDTKEPKLELILNAIREDLERSRPGAIAFTDTHGRRSQMHIATYGLFLSEYFKDALL